MVTISMDSMIAYMNFCIGSFSVKQRAMFFRWLDEHARILNKDGLVLDRQLDNRFRAWLGRLPDQAQESEIFIILSEIAWVKAFRAESYSHIKPLVRVSP
jgi:hypothetical protein